MAPLFPHITVQNARKAHTVVLLSMSSDKSHTHPPQCDKWTSPWKVNNKVIHPPPHPSLSLSEIESHGLGAAEIQL